MKRSTLVRSALALAACIFLFQGFAQAHHGWAAFGTGAQVHSKRP
jgi:hypothetical protein